MHAVAPTLNDPLEVFSDLTQRGSRLRFYTLQTRHEIPSTPGCYAWFVPLWIYEDDLDQLTQTVADILHYDYQPKQDVEAPFTWRTILLNVTEKNRIRNTQATRATWERLIADPTARSELEQILLEATLLMPPLYVGKTNNLSRRYQEHTDPDRKDRNDFRTRFSDHMRKLNVQLSVSDLLFACIHTPPQRTAALNTFDPNGVEELLERLLMHFCQPPFSLK